MTIGEFEAKLGEMSEKHKKLQNAQAASLLYLREIHRTAKVKEADVWSACPFFQSKGGCPLAKDISGKPIFSPDYIVVCLLNVWFRIIFRLKNKEQDKNQQITSGTTSQ